MKLMAGSEQTSANKEIHALTELPIDMANAPRRPDLNPELPLILIFTGPDSKDFMKKLSKIPNIHCFNQDMNEMEAKMNQQVMAAMMISGEEQAVVCVNFPRSETQLEWLLSKIGGISSAALVDFKEDDLLKRADSLASRTNTSAEMVNIYKQQTMPAIHWLDRSGKLKLIVSFNFQL